jgi:hypothetical protein
MSGIATRASWHCYFRALKFGEASRVAPSTNFRLFSFAVFGAAFLGERLTPANWSRHCPARYSSPIRAERARNRLAPNAIYE